MNKIIMLHRCFGLNILYVFLLFSFTCVACSGDDGGGDSPEPIPQLVTDITTKIVAQKNDLEVSVKAKLSDTPNYDYNRSVVVRYRLSENDDWVEEQASMIENAKFDLQAQCLLKNLAPETEYTVQVVCAIRTVEFPDESMKSTTLVRHYSLYDIYPYSGEPQGIVWQVFNNGLNGRILSLDEGYEKWSTELILTEAGSPEGKENMARVKAIDPTLKKYPAFKWCAAKGDGWYFLAEETFKVDVWAMNAVLEGIGKTPLVNGNGSYWTSRESDRESAWPNHWIGGSMTPYSKTGFMRVRACKEF